MWVLPLPGPARIARVEAGEETAVCWEGLRFWRRVEVEGFMVRDVWRGVFQRGGVYIERLRVRGEKLKLFGAF